MSAESVWKCSECGAPIPEGARKCPKCHVRITEWVDEPRKDQAEPGSVSSKRAAGMRPMTTTCASCKASVGLDSSFCPKCGAEVIVSDTERQVALLTAEVANLNDRMNNMLPQTDILSRNFWTRAAAVFGHGLAFNVVLMAVIYIVLFACAGMGILGSN